MTFRVLQFDRPHLASVHWDYSPRTVVEFWGIARTRKPENLAKKCAVILLTSIAPSWHFVVGPTMDESGCSVISEEDRRSLCRLAQALEGDIDDSTRQALLAELDVIAARYANDAVYSE